MRNEIIYNGYNGEVYLELELHLLELKTSECKHRGSICW